jgi:hypothetical protein
VPSRGNKGGKGRRNRHRTDRNTPSEPLGKGNDIWPNPLEHGIEGGSGSANPGLDLIEDEEGFILSRELSDAGKIARGREVSTTLCLNWFKKECGYAVCKGSFQSGDLPKRNGNDVGEKRKKGGLELLLSSETQSTCCTSVKTVVGNENDRFVPEVTVNLGDLQGGFIRFSTAVAEEKGEIRIEPGTQSLCKKVLFGDLKEV